MHSTTRTYPQRAVSSPLISVKQGIKRGWIVDLDGVLINQQAQRMRETGLFTVLAERLALGEPVMFHTGRSLKQVVTHMLDPLAHVVRDEQLLQRVILVGEHGGAWASYRPDGVLDISFDPRFSVPPLFRATVRELIQASEFTDLLEMEMGKRTMVTVAMREDVPGEACQAIQEHVAWLLRHCLLCHGLAETWKVEVNGNGVEVEQRQAGKRLGAQRMIAWLQTHHIDLTHMIAFGDSISNLVMGEALSSHSPVECMCVDRSDRVEANSIFPIIRTQAHNELGIIEYFSRPLSSADALLEADHA